MGDDLKGLQARLFRLVTERDPAPGRAPLSDWLRAEDEAAARERVRVYRNGYAFRCFDCLRDDFPAVAALAGADGFAQLAGDYIARHPPTHPSLRHLGAGFAAFAAESALARRLPWIGELAALEWARVEAFDAATVVPLTADDLLATPIEEWPSVRLRLAPSVRTLEFRHAVDGVWRELEDAGRRARPDREGPEALDAPLTPTSVVVYRREHVVYHRRVDSREGAALRHVARGAPFAEVCGAFAAAKDSQNVDCAAQEAFGALAQWVADGLLARGATRGSSSSPASFL
jgi:hypothetical protein